MRVLHVVPTYAPGFRYGGPVASVRGLAEAQVRRGDAVTVATTDRDDGVRLDAPATEVMGGVLVRRFAVRGPERVRRAPALAQWLDRAAEEFDVVHAHGVFVWTTTAALRAARRAGTPTVLAPRGMLMGEMLAARGSVRKRLWLAALERTNLAGLDALHLTAEAELDALPHGIAPRARRLVVPNGVQPCAWDGSCAGLAPDIAALVRGDAPYVLYLGRVHWKKGLDRLVTGFARTRQELRLVVAGPDGGALAGLVRAARRLGVEGRICVVGEVEGAAKAALLGRANVLALTSLSENFGNSVLEALAAGCPAVVTPEVGAAEAVLALRGGRVSEPTPDALAAALESVAFDAGRRADRRSLGERTRAAYGWDSIAGALAAGYLAIGAAGWPRAA